MTDAYVEINLSALRQNARIITEKYSEYDALIGVVKGDAYGHGYRAAKALYEGGVGYFAVSSLDEAAAFREELHDVPLLCLEPVAIKRIHEAAALGLTLAIPSLSYLKALCDSGTTHPFPLHLQIDAGFNRLGFKDADEIKAASELIESSPFTLEGVYQHYATAGIYDPYFDAQTKRFEALVSKIDLSKIPMIHLGSGAAMTAHRKPAIANSSRMGLMMYGYDIAPDAPGSGVKDRLRSLKEQYYRRRYHLSETVRGEHLPLTPAMAFKCRILQIKDVLRGEHIGYSAAYTADRDMKIAILPVGYNNGVGHQNHGRTVEINGAEYPVVGVIGMNMLSVSIDDRVQEDDVVTLLGGSITLGRFSRAAGLGLAEALLGIGKNNPRVYLD